MVTKWLLTVCFLNKGSSLVLVRNLFNKPLWPCCYQCHWELCKFSHPPDGHFWREISRDSVLSWRQTVGYNWWMNRPQINTLQIRAHLMFTPSMRSALLGTPMTPIVGFVLAVHQRANKHIHTVKAKLQAEEVSHTITHTYQHSTFTQLGVAHTYKHSTFTQLGVTHIHTVHSHS